MLDAVEHHASNLAEYIEFFPEVVDADQVRDMLLELSALLLRAQALHATGLVPQAEQQPPRPPGEPQGQPPPPPGEPEPQPQPPPRPQPQHPQPQPQPPAQQPHLVPARPGFGPPAKAAVLKAAPSVFTGAVEPRAASFQPPAKGPPPFHMQAIPQPMHWPKTPPPGCAPHRWQPESEPASATSSFVPAARHQPKGHAGVQFPTPSPPRPPPPTREPPQ